MPQAVPEHVAPVWSCRPASRYGRGEGGTGLVVELRLRDVVRLKKPHPCGGFEWEVVRLGADIGLVCAQCGRRVLMGRSALEKRLKMVVGQDM